MRRYKTIWRSESALSGWSYRVTSNGQTCHIQEKHFNHLYWRTKKNIPCAEWYEFSDKNNLESPYNSNPYPVFRLANYELWMEVTEG